MNGGTCNPGTNAYTCTCANLTTGARCETSKYILWHARNFLMRMKYEWNISLEFCTYHYCHQHRHHRHHNYIHHRNRRFIVGTTNRYGEVQPRHPYPPWCPPLAPCTAPNQLQNRHTGSRLYSRHRPGLFRWRLRSGDCSPWTNQPAFSDAWRSCDPSNTSKIGRTEFPYIRTDGVELDPWFPQAFCYKPRTFSKRTEHIPV